MKIKLTNELRDDFSDFWDFWVEVEDFAMEIVRPREDGTVQLGLPNRMMIAAWAAGVWFRRGKWAEKQAKKGKEG